MPLARHKPDRQRHHIQIGHLRPLAAGKDRDEFWQIAFESFSQSPYAERYQKIALGVFLRILSAELHDYLSFRDCPPIEFHEGINLVVGTNNSGKSALLKALNPNLPAQANRSEERFRESELPSPNVTLTIRISGEHIRQAALEQGGDIFIPTPDNTYMYDDALRFLAFFFDKKDLAGC